MITKPAIVLSMVVAILAYAEAGMDQFLRNSLYSIKSMKDDGALSLTNTSQNTYKMVTMRKWEDLDAQKWVVKDFQSLGFYEFTPLVYNTSSNMFTYQFTKNVYTHKRQWKVNLLPNQRYEIRNPESGLCLTNMGFNEQVDETDCDPTNQLSQTWKFKMLRK